MNICWPKNRRKITLVEKTIFVGERGGGVFL